MLRLRLSQGISSGCQNANPTQFFWICHQSGKGALCFFFDLARVYFTVAPCHHKSNFFFSKLSLVWQRELCFCLDLGREFLQGATMPPYTNFFLFFEIVISVAKVNYASAQIQQGYFFRAPSCQHYAPNYFSELSVWDKGHYVSASNCLEYLFRVNYGTTTPKKFLDLSLLQEGALRFGFDLAKLFLQGAKHATPTLFFWNCHQCRKGALCFVFDLARVYFRVHHATIKPNFFIFRNCHQCGKGELCFCFDFARIFLQGAPCHHYTQTFSGIFSVG